MSVKTWFRRNHHLAKALGLWGSLAVLLVLALITNVAQGGRGFALPSSDYWLGTGADGVPLAELLAQGAWRSISVAVLVTVPALAIGYLVGGIWALRRADLKWRGALSVLTLSFLGPTPLLLILAVVYALQGHDGPWIIALAITVVAWPAIALRVHNEIKGLESEVCIQQARRDGATAWDLLLNECLPLLIPVLSALGVLTSISAITSEATISYLGATSGRSLGALLATTSDAFTQGKYGAVVNLLLCVGGTLAILVGGLYLLRNWLDDRRVMRAIPEMATDAQHTTLAQDGWMVSVKHRSTGVPLALDAAIPYRPGEITVIAGGSGSSKTITTQAIAGALDPALKANVTSRLPSQLSILYVPQGLQELFAPHRTVDDYRDMAGLTELQMKAMITEMGLSEAELRDAHGEPKRMGALSGGMAQRLAVGLITAAREPDVLILDEPVSALDDENASRLGRAVRLWLKRHPQAAVIVVNHRIEWTRAYADHVVFMNHGRSVWNGTLSAFDALGAQTAPTALRPYIEAIEVLAGTTVSKAPATHYTTDEVVLSVADVTLQYPGASTPVCSGLSFDARRGEIKALVSPSGGGKSTLLDAIVGNIVPHEGDIRIAGAAPDRRSLRFRQRVQLCPQNPALTLNPHVTVGRALHRAAKRRHVVEHGRWMVAVEAACLKAGLPLEALGKTPRELSGGMRARAGLAQALLGQVELLLADEMTAGLDPEVALMVLDTLKSLSARDGLTIVMAAHDVAHVQHLGAGIISLTPGGQLRSRIEVSA
ncbi:MAG: ATP-binding cassette domain-containing protein [Bradymonadia bacterium]